MDQVNLFAERVNGVLQTSPLGQRVARFPVTFTVVVLSVIFHLACLIGNEQTVMSWLAVSPSATLMAGKFWTIVTSSLLENNSTKFFLFGAFVAYASYQLELEWGSLPLAKHLLVVSVLASLASALVFIAVYMTTLNDEIFFSHVFGLGGYVVALYVGLLKLRRLRLVSAEVDGSDMPTSSPESIVTVPAILAYSLLGLRFPLHDALLVVFALFVAVMNLRTPDFNFRNFLPEFARRNRRNAVAAMEAVMPIPTLTSPDPTKERFRQRGFKLLDKKLAELEAAPEVPLDGSGVTAEEAIENKV